MAQRNTRVSHIDTYSCECPDFLSRCKGKGYTASIYNAIILFNKLKNKVEMDDFQVEDITDEKVCPKCKSENIIKRGIRKNKSGTKQRYKCHNCWCLLSFLTLQRGSRVMLVWSALLWICITRAIRLRDIQDTIYQSFGLKLHHETIRRWNNRFMGKINNYVSTLKPQTSEKMHIDEQVIK